MNAEFPRRPNQTPQEEASTRLSKTASCNRRIAILETSSLHRNPPLMPYKTIGEFCFFLCLSFSLIPLSFDRDDDDNEMRSCARVSMVDVTRRSRLGIGRKTVIVWESELVSAKEGDV